jgi:hypothetical protein
MQIVEAKLVNWDNGKAHGEGFLRRNEKRIRTG